MPLLESFLADKEFEKDKQPSGFIKLLVENGVLETDFDNKRNKDLANFIKEMKEKNMPKNQPSPP